MITAKQAAEILNVTKIRVIQFCRQGRIPARKRKRDGAWYMKKSDVLEFKKIPRLIGNPNFSIPGKNPGNHEKKKRPPKEASTTQV
jgi:hypothetical protein